MDKPFLWTEGRVSLRAALNKSAYGHGEHISVTIDVRNDSRKIIRKIRVGSDVFQARYERLTNRGKRAIMPNVIFVHHTRVSHPSVCVFIFGFDRKINAQTEYNPMPLIVV